MKFSAVAAAKSFAATHAVKLSERQHKAYVAALARSLADAYNQGYKQGLKEEAIRNGVWEDK